MRNGRVEGLRRTWVWGVALAAGVLVLPAAGAAQGEPPPGDPLRIWLAFGLAPVGAGSDLDVTSGLVAQLAVQKAPHQISLRGASGFDLSNFPEAGSDDAVSEIGLLYGRTWVGSFAHASVSAGGAVVFVDGCDAEGTSIYDEGLCTTVGVPLTAEAALQTTFAGVGLQAFANINPEASYGGLALFVQLGWMP